MSRFTASSDRPADLLREAGAAAGASRVPPHPGPRLNRGPGRFFFQSLDKPAPSRYNKNEERTTHAVAPQFSLFSCDPFGSRKQPSLGRVAVVFFAFLFSFTMIVTVYFPMWKVIRIFPTSFRRCRSNRLRVCVRPSALAGSYNYTESNTDCQSFRNNIL